MRFLLYNIRYGTGGKKFLLPWSGYLRRTAPNVRNITQFIKSLNPDMIGLIEIDIGSYRSGKKNQAETIAHALGHYNAYRSKYGEFS
ncbi:MAG: endonuclease, partial [Verrucomicrobia bacterium]|nr:endonuclease [Verrucomicrobiota bacterium]